MQHEDEFFLKEMMDVVPLKKRSKGRLSRKGTSASRIDFSERQTLASKVTRDQSNFLVEDGITPLDAFYILSFKRDGIQNGVYRKLKQGRYAYEAALDLHRCTISQARKEVFEFIEEAHTLGLRMVLLIHGKGRFGPIEGRKSVLKGYTNFWLRQIPLVQAFHSARNQDGGTGAVYVLLNKNRDPSGSRS